MNRDFRPLISIIVPVFNVEKYIVRCIESILAQSYGDWEIIAIDDGSQDNSGSILDKYADNNNRIKVFHISNSGVSHARNIGIDKAKGKYVCFIDSDDWIKSDMLELMANYAIRYECDFVQVEFSQVSDEGEVYRNICKSPGVIEGCEDILLAYSQEIIHNSICSKLIRRETIGDVRLNEKLHIGEDAQFTFDICKRSKTVFLAEQDFYQYYQRKNSAIHSNYNPELFEILEVLESQMEATEQIDEVYDNLRLRKGKNIIRLFEIFSETNGMSAMMQSLRGQMRKELIFCLHHDISIALKIKALLICYFPTCFSTYRRMRLRKK